MKQIARLGLIGAAALASAPAFARSGGSLVGMGDLAGGEFYSCAVSITADGSVVVGASDMGHNPPNTYAPTAARWTRTTGIQPLDGLVESGISSNAQHVSSNGSAIGGTVTDGQTVGSFLWTQVGGVRLLSAPSASWEEFGSLWLSGVSSDGAVAVGVFRYLTEGLLMTRAVRWVSGTAQFMPGLENSDRETQARAVSDDGRIVVGVLANENGDFVPFRWTEAEGLEVIEVPAAFDNYWVTAASADASVIVGTSYYYAQGAPGDTPFRWTQESGLVSLDTNSIAIGGDAWDVSADGRFIVGRVGLNAAIWRGNSPPMLLTEYLSQRGVSGFDGWRLWNATGISADGATIVGSGTNPEGFGEGFIATIPPHCPGDADRDGSVTVADISATLAHWQSSGPQGDANDDFIVDFNDITETLTNWQGECP